MIIAYLLDSSYNNGEVQTIAYLETVYGKAKKVFTCFFLVVMEYVRTNKT